PPFAPRFTVTSLFRSRTLYSLETCLGSSDAITLFDYSFKRCRSCFSSCLVWEKAVGLVVTAHCISLLGNHSFTTLLFNLFLSDRSEEHTSELQSREHL